MKTTRREFLKLALLAAVPASVLALPKGKGKPHYWAYDINEGIESDAITYEDILRAREILDANDVPMPRKLELTQEQVNDLLSGEIGRYEGFTWIPSGFNEIPTSPRHDWWNQGRKY